MKDEKTVEKSQDPGGPEGRTSGRSSTGTNGALRPRADEIFIKKFGFDPDPVYKAGLIAEFIPGRVAAAT